MNTINVWYEEDFISGEPCYSFGKSEEVDTCRLFQKEIAPCLEQMILSQPPATSDFGNHVSKTVGSVENREFSGSMLDANCVSIIRQYLKKTSSCLINKQIDKIDLVFSHGDYSLVNIQSLRPLLTGFYAP